MSALLENISSILRLTGFRESSAGTLGSLCKKPRIESMIMRNSIVQETFGSIASIESLMQFISSLDIQHTLDRRFHRAREISLINGGNSTPSLLVGSWEIVWIYYISLQNCGWTQFLTLFFFSGFRGPSGCRNGWKPVRGKQLEKLRLSKRW